MKKVLASTFAILALAAAAQAVTIGLEWSGNTANPQSGLINTNTPVTARFYLQNGGTTAQGPNSGAVGVILNAWSDAACTIPADGVVFQTGNAAQIAGWSTAAANSNADLNGTQFAAVAGPVFQFPNGKTYIENITLQATTLGTYYITILRDSTGGDSSVVVDSSGADYVGNDAIWYDSNIATAGKGRWGFGNWGGSTWSRFDSGTSTTYSQQANPLVLTVVPEPASLALLAIGGFALLRRR